MGGDGRVWPQAWNRARAGAGAIVWCRESGFAFGPTVSPGTPLRFCYAETSECAIAIDTRVKIRVVEKSKKFWEKILRTPIS